MAKQKNRALSGIIAIVLVALLCAGAFFLARSIASGRSSALKGATATPAYADQTIDVLGEGMLYYDGTTLHALNQNGKQIWTYAVGANAGFSVGTGGVAAWTGTMLSLLASKDGATTFGGNVEDTVLDVYVGGMYSAVQVGTEHNSVMLLLDHDGRKVDRIEFKNQTILDFGFFNNDALFWVMSLDTEGTVPLCSISTYRPGKMLAGTITDTQQVLYEVLFQSSKIRAVGTTHIKDYSYSAKENTADRMLVYGWYLMGMDERSQNPLMAFVPIDQSDGVAGISDIRMIRGQIDQSVRLPYPANRVLALDDTVYAFTNQYVMVCRLGETAPTAYTLPMYIDSALGITESKKAIVTSGGSVYLLPLP